MLSIRTRRCALCLTLCDWEQQQPLRPSRAGLRVRMLSCRGRCTMLWNRLSRAIITCSRCTFLQSRAITTCSRCTFLQSHAITTCSRCTLLVVVSARHSHPAPGRSARSAEKCTCCRFDSHCSIFGPAATRHSCDRNFVSATESRWCRSAASRWAWTRRPHTVHALGTGTDQSEAWQVTTRERM